MQDLCDANALAWVMPMGRNLLDDEIDMYNKLIGKLSGFQPMNGEEPR